MTHLILPLWTDPHGATTGPMNYPTARTDAEIERLVRRGFDAARMARGTDARVIVMDDVTGRTIKTFHNGDEIDMAMTGKEALAGHKMVNAIRTVAEAAGFKGGDIVRFIEGLDGAGIDLVAREMPVERVSASELEMG